MEPLIKWPGGKRFLADCIIDQLPEKRGRYFEPFVGGGAIFFALEAENAFLSDTNIDLIEMYEQVKAAPDSVIRSLKRLRNSEADYYRIRQSGPKTPQGRAARLLYLARFAFNGIHRYNLKGQFNVPYGYKAHMKVCDEELIMRASGVLKRAHLRHADFEEAVSNTVEGDLIYFDPPYTVAHNRNGFVKYNASIFSWKDQERLAALAFELVQRGCQVIVSNADHETVRNLYPRFTAKTIKRYSIIGSRAAYRRPITECLFIGNRK